MAQREYELTVIIKAEGSVDGARQFRDRLASIITSRSGIVLHNLDLGRRSLAYAIAKQKKGHYLYFDFVADGTVVAELERICRLDESVVRFLTIQSSDRVDVGARQASHDADLKRLENIFGLGTGPVVTPPPAAPTHAKDSVPAVA